MSEGQGRGPGPEGNINHTYRRTLDAIERRTDAQDLIDLDKLTREHGADLQPSHIARADAITADLDKLAARYDAAFQTAGRSAEQTVLSLREGVESALIEQRREREAVPDQHQPTLYVVAGPNGSGKSTITRAGAFADARIVDPDAIARHLSPEDPEGASATAGREAIRERTRAMAKRENIAIETTLSGSSALRFVDQAQAAGYQVELHYISVASPAQSIDRISQRVSEGGHHVPAADVERRFERSRENLPEAIARADRTTVYDNSSQGRAPQIAAELTRDRYDIEPNAPAWVKDAAGKAAELSFAQATDQQGRDAAFERAREAAAADGLDVKRIEAGQEKGRAADESVDRSTPKQQPGRDRNDDGFGM
ncbi:zeta toxin family protein [Phaeobacter inhibens]|uniref:zeta toxin family protein n=1 Tax=Phaeobacter inhibens TaxID=221822 RepID=UPI0026E1ADE2|nr:zeta toxin family protein [Phaeobacter inhibens]MDO6758065.1 zeta toxin family protein [Phaeobacter inhibens]